MSTVGVYAVRHVMHQEDTLVHQTLKGSCSHGGDVLVGRKWKTLFLRYSYAYKLGVLLFYPDTTWGSCRPHWLMTQSHWLPPTSDTNHKLRPPALLNRPAINRGVPTIISLGSIICWYDSKNVGKCFTYYHLFILKVTNQEWPDERDAWGTVWGRGRASVPSPGVPPSQHLDVFTKPEAFQILLFRVLMEALLHRHDCLSRWPLTIELNLQPFPGIWGVGPEAPTL